MLSLTNMGGPKQSHVEKKKTVHELEIYWLFGKVKVPAASVSKECHADSQLEHKITHYCWFLEKGAIVNIALYC